MRRIFIAHQSGLIDYKGEDPALFTGAETVQGGIVCTYAGASGEDVWPNYAPPQPPKLVVTALSSEDPTALVAADLSEVTCKSGATVSATIELRDGQESIVPIDESFRMPLRARDGRERILLVTLVGGIAQVEAVIAESGLWQVAEAAINESLPSDKYMVFDGLSIYTVL